MPTAGALSQNTDLLSSLMTSMFGKKTTTTQGSYKDTEQTQFSTEAVNAMLKSLMEGAGGRQGLAAVAGAQKIPGLYGSTTQMLMVNDLLSRSAGEVAQRTAPKVTERQAAPKIEQTKGALNSPLGLLGAGALALGSATGRKTIRDVWSDLSDPKGTLDAFTATMKGYGDTSILQATPADFVGDFAPSGFDDFGNYGEMAGIFDFGDASVFASDAVYEEMAGISDFYAEADAGFDLMGAPISAGIKALSGDIGGAAETAALYAVNPVLALVDSVSGGAISEAAGDIWEAVTGGCFITTAICKLYGKTDDCYELTTLRNYRDSWLAENHPEAIDEYYAIAPTIVAEIDLREDSAKIWSALYRDYLAAAIEAIESKSYETAYIIYRNMVELAKEIANGS